MKWIDLFSKTRTKAILRDNILSSWRGVGILPFRYRKVFKNLLSALTLSNIPLYTPLKNITFNLLLFKSSSLEAIKLSKLNKRCIERITYIYKTQNTTIAIITKQLAEQSEYFDK